MSFALMFFRLRMLRRELPRICQMCSLRGLEFLDARAEFCAAWQARARGI
jgi:hypothetical protein